MQFDDLELEDASKKDCNETTSSVQQEATASHPIDAFRATVEEGGGAQLEDVELEDHRAAFVRQKRSRIKTRRGKRPKKVAHKDEQNDLREATASCGSDEVRAASGESERACLDDGELEDARTASAEEDCKAAAASDGFCRWQQRRLLKSAQLVLVRLSSMWGRSSSAQRLYARQQHIFPSRV
eukprot:gnl/TRDRNA2_/TRDRNA2_145400_c0_seq2.p1 gnl/TRDRNA2_/TRDRNA2_145400_c0~~gnl/TRDRNA2_/TRDRNA2_145400_c0_seq2.p1  ORF type:complete len:213 (-),score=52.74 gnl/TRDRNA2_/TRDRNA2_145400_c0_seq2:265-813(-)